MNEAIVVAFLIGLSIGLLGAATAILAVNNMWHRASRKQNDEWAEFARAQNERWHAHAMSIIDQWRRSILERGDDS